jgi:glycerate kinase
MILYSPDSYGGFLSAPEAVAIAEAELPDLVGHPMADGGEGSLSAMDWHRPLDRRIVRVTGPYGAPINALIGENRDGCFIESSLACGLALTAQREPLLAGTFGVGELLLEAEGPIRIGLGGSATIDGGLGMLQALGLVLLDAHGAPLEAPFVAGDLADVHTITGPMPALPPITVLLDVERPLADAAPVFGPQKGLRPDQLDGHIHAMARVPELISRWRAQHGLPPIPADLPGGGAAGGLGYALAALGATMTAGAPHFAQLTGLAGRIAEADAVVIGEGRLDASSYQGKVAGEVTRLARAAGRPVWAVVGSARDVPPPPLGPDRIILIGGMDQAIFRAALRRLM